MWSWRRASSAMPRRPRRRNTFVPADPRCSTPSSAIPRLFPWKRPKGSICLSENTAPRNDNLKGEVSLALLRALQPLTRPESFMPILVVGSVAYDSVETPFGRQEKILGGSGTYFSTSASFFTDVSLVG